MDDTEILKWRDGNYHQIGPLRLRFTGIQSVGPEGVCTIRTERSEFKLDWRDAEAIAYCIAPSKHLWGAYDSDRKTQPDSSERRGWLRFKITADESLLEGLTGWAGRAFQVGRIIMDAGTGEIVKHRDGQRSTDYRRAFLTKLGGPATRATRTSFIQASTVLGRHFQPSLPPNWENLIRGRWWWADQTVGDIEAVSDDDP